MSGLNRLILGHMPMIGVSYQSREKDKEYREQFADAREMKKLLDASIDLGFKRFAVAAPSSSPLASLHIETIKKVLEDDHDIQLIPCMGIPIKLGNRNIEAFRRWATYLAIEEKIYPEVRQRILDDPILNFREHWRNWLPLSKPYENEVFGRFSIDWKVIEEDLERFADLPVQYMEPGSETDFLAMTDRLDLLGELLDKIREYGFKSVLLGVHHAGITIPSLEKFERLNGFVTPLNPVGVMMFPTQESAEEAVKRTKKLVYAIKPLAGGRVKPTEAFRYVFKFDVQGCMIGAGSVSELTEDTRSALKAIEEREISLSSKN